MRTQVPLSAAPVQIASNRSPILEASSIAASDLATNRSTLLASSSFSVQCRANSASSCRVFRKFDDIFTRAEKFNDAKRKIGKTKRVGCFLSGQETREGR